MKPLIFIPLILLSILAANADVKPSLTCHASSDMSSNACRRYGIRIDKSTYDQLAAKGITVIVGLLNKTEGELKGNLQFSIYTSNLVSIPVAELELEIGAPHALVSRIPIRTWDENDASNSYVYSVSLAHVRLARLKFFFDYPEDYEEKRHYYYIDIQHIVELNAINDYRLKGVLDELNQMD